MCCFVVMVLYSMDCFLLESDGMVIVPFPYVVYLMAEALIYTRIPDNHGIFSEDALHNNDKICAII